MTKKERPVRVGVFGSVAAADAAVHGLAEAGFDRAHISVVCSDETKEHFFREYEHEKPAGTKTPGTALKGGIAGAIVGGLFTAIGLVATGGLGLVVIGPLFVGHGAAFGTFIGAMMSRGVEREVANFYDQALRRGQILVAGESDDPEMLLRAERVFEEAGAHPVKLPAG